MAALTPFSDARPGWKRFVIAPSARNAHVPPAYEPAMPSAEVNFAASSFSSDAAPAAAPNVPHVPVE
jgi:hypothetical protein